MAVSPGSETSGTSGTEIHFFHIRRTSWGSLASVSGGVGTCGGWWILEQSCTTCSAISFRIPHFLQVVSTACLILCSQCLSFGWQPLLRRPIIVCSFLDNFDSSMRSCFSHFTPFTRGILSLDITPLVERLMVAFTES